MHVLGVLFGLTTTRLNKRYYYYYYYYIYPELFPVPICVPVSWPSQPMGCLLCYAPTPTVGTVWAPSLCWRSRPR